MVAKPATTPRATEKVSDIGFFDTQAQFGGDNKIALRNGRLADLVPTMLELMGLEKPDVMDGQSLIVRK